jgi:hypothetical protein
LSDFILALAASHSALESDTQPLPLQEFWPWQELVAVEQADLPLHELTPSHFTLAASAALAEVSGAALNNIAAAVAIAIPENLCDFCM